MQKTTNLGLNKPEGDDNYNIDDFNDNMDKIDTAINDLNNFAINETTPTFDMASKNAELVSGEKMSVAFGKIAKAIKSFIEHLTTTASSTVLGHIKVTPGNGLSNSSGTVSIGKGTGTDYGTVKLSDTYDSKVTNGAAANSIGASQNALYEAYNTLNSEIVSDFNDVDTLLDFINIQKSNKILPLSIQKYGNKQLSDLPSDLVDREFCALVYGSHDRAKVIFLPYPAGNHELLIREIFGNNWLSDWSLFDINDINNKIGTTDISSIGNGTITDAIRTLNSKMVSGAVNTANRSNILNSFGVEHWDSNDIINGGFGMFYYEGHDTSEYNIPYPYCMVLVCKQSTARGVAIAIQWNTDSSISRTTWINTLWDNWKGWVRIDPNSDIQTLQSNFQVGVDSIYNLCVSAGSTPSSKALTDVQAAMQFFVDAQSYIPDLANCLACAKRAEANGWATFSINIISVGQTWNWGADSNWKYHTVNSSEINGYVPVGHASLTNNGQSVYGNSRGATLLQFVNGTSVNNATSGYNHIVIVL